MSKSISNIQGVISKVSENLGISRSRVEQVYTSYWNEVTLLTNGESTNKLLPDGIREAITVPYVGAFVLQQKQFFSEMLLKFVILRKLQRQLDKYDPESKRYKNALSKYKVVSANFRLFWEYKQKMGWRFVKSKRKLSFKGNYFNEQKQKENREYKINKRNGLI